MEKKRKHRKTIITNVNPRPQWTALRTKNQRLIFGYLVAKTSIKRKGIEIRLDRHEVLTDKEKCWNGVYVTNDELATFLISSTGLSKSACPNTIKRTLEHLEKVGYIIVHYGAILINQHKALRAIEVLWDDKKYSFIRPLNPELSNPALTKSKFCLNSALTKIDSALTKTHKNVKAPNATYGQTKPRIDDFEGAYINNKIINNGGAHENETSAGALNYFSPSQHEAKSESQMPQDDTHATLSSMIPGSNFFDQSDLLPAFRVRQDPLRTRFDKPADMLSYYETPGIKDTGHDDAVKILIKHIKKTYDYDATHIFEAENYRRLICPDLRADLPLEFGDLPTDLIEDNFHLLPHVFDRHMQSRLYQDIPDMFHRVVTLFRLAPRGISYSNDTGGYWYPPVMPMALDYSSYTKSPKTTESKFHRDATTSQLREIIYASQLPEVEVGGKRYSGLYFNAVLKRQIFWLAGVTAMSRESLEGMLPRFEKELLQNSKSPDFIRYKKKIETGDFGNTNLINWFKDLCFRYHYHGWYSDRLRSDDGMLFLAGLGACCDTSGAASGTIAYIPTPWGQNREMYFTKAQWKMYEKFKNTLMLSDIGQDSL